MIDCHAHLLPGIDDGAASVTEAKDMLQALYKQGVEAVICTPHYDPVSVPIGVFASMRNDAIGQLKDTVIPIIAASETYLHECLLYYREITSLCVQGSNYLLVELPFDKPKNRMYVALVEKLIDQFDVIPIVAHIERYSYIKERDIRELRDMGCMVQMNLGALQRLSLIHISEPTRPY